MCAYSAAHVVAFDSNYYNLEAYGHADSCLMHGMS